MKKYYSFDYLRCLWSKTKRNATVIFAVATTLMTFVSLEGILNKLNANSIWTRIGFLIILCILAVIVGVVSLKMDEKKPVVLYSKEKTHIQVEFGDMKNYITDNNNGQIYSVVIPINTHMDIVAEEDVIRKTSMHGFLLKRINEAGITKDVIKTEILKQIENVNNDRCPIGSSCYLRNIDNVNYLLVATCEVNGTKSTCTEQQYFQGLQSMVDALVEHCDKQETIYIPVIGGGYANMQKSNQQLLRQMSEILLFNNQKLQHDIHIIVYDNLRGDILLSALRIYEQ